MSKDHLVDSHRQGLANVIKHREIDREDLAHLQRTLGNAAFARLLENARGLGGNDELPARPDVVRDTGPGLEAAQIREALNRLAGLGHKDTEEQGSTTRDGILHNGGEGGGTTAPTTTATTPTFPNITQIRASGTVTTEIEADWTASESDYNERAAWVMWDSSNGNYSVVGKATGTWASCTPTPKPADAGTNYHVGHYHIHPQLPPAEQPNTDKWPVAPSGADRSFATSNNSPGFVKDFVDTKRKPGATTYYNYGPTVRG